MRNTIVFFLLVCTLPLHASVQGDLRSGGKLYQQKKYGQALGKYNAILQENPSDPEAALGAGAAAYYLKDYAAAQAAFTQAAETNFPRQQDALFNLGNTYYRAGNTEKAKQTYRQAILKNPQDKEAIHNLQLLLENNQNQQNQNNQNQQNQDKNSPNQQPQNQQQADKQPQDQQPQPSQADKDAADRVMQMAQGQEAKQQPQNGPGAADEWIEKDW